MIKNKKLLATSVGLLIAAQISFAAKYLTPSIEEIISSTKIEENEEESENNDSEEADSVTHAATYIGPYVNHDVEITGILKAKKEKFLVYNSITEVITVWLEDENNQRINIIPKYKTSDLGQIFHDSAKEILPAGTISKSMFKKTNWASQLGKKTILRGKLQSSFCYLENKNKLLLKVNY